VILALLTHRVAGPIAAGVAFVLSIALLWTVATSKAKDGVIKHQGGEIGSLNTQLGQCRANVSALNDSLMAQNAAVEALKEEGARRAKEAAKALEEARSAAQGRNKRIETIRTAKPEGELCAAAFDLLRGKL
jgi:capsule polysaccharide export protein KpsE/RkpR